MLLSRLSGLQVHLSLLQPPRVLHPKSAVQTLFGFPQPELQIEIPFLVVGLEHRQYDFSKLSISLVSPQMAPFLRIVTLPDDVRSSVIVGLEEFAA